MVKKAPKKRGPGAPRQYHEPTTRIMIRVPDTDLARWRAATDALAKKLGVDLDLSKFIRRATNAAIGRAS